MQTTGRPHPAPRETTGSQDQLGEYQHAAGPRPGGAKDHGVQNHSPLGHHRGYVFKATMMAHGTIKLKKKEYTEVYRQYFKNNQRSHWRMMQAFFGGNYWWSAKKQSSRTPGKLLQEIHDDLSDEEKSRTYTLVRFIEHPNCPLDLALRIGTMKTPEHSRSYYQDDFENLRNKAMLKVAEITKRESANSR